jgi:hypothetical protein
MVRRVLDGSKTQTRRVVKSPAKNTQAKGQAVIRQRAAGDPWYGDHVWSMRDRDGVWQDYTDNEFLSRCPYGVAGDRLWVRETWQAFDAPDGSDRYGVAYRATCQPDGSFTWVGDDGGGSLSVAAMQIARWRPSIFMPRWASRITLDVVSVRVERLHDITEEDARAEVVEREVVNDCGVTRDLGWRNYLWHGHVGKTITALQSDAWHHQFSTYADAPNGEGARGSFSSLWESINGPGSWDANPWVWVVEFRRAT